MSLDDLDASGMNEATSIKLNFDEEEEPIELLEEEVVDDDDGVPVLLAEVGQTLTNYAVRVLDRQKKRRNLQTSSRI